MSTKSGTNAFHGSGAYLMRHEGLNANSFSNNAQGIAKSEFRVNDVGGSIGGPIRRNSAVLLQQLPRAPQQPGIDDVDDRADGARAHRQLQPDVHPRRERQCGSGADLRSFQRRPGRARSLSPRRGSQRDHRQPAPGGAQDVQLLRAAEPHAGRRVQHQQLRGEHDRRRSAATATTTASTCALGKHSIYASGGISYATITTPRPFGESPVNGAAGIRSDDNPYFQIGDAIVLSNSVVIDVRYGLSHIDTKSFTGDKEGFTDFTGFGVPANLQPLMAFPEAAPVVNPNGFNGGSGGGSNWTAMSVGTFGTKLEVQSNHSFAGSITKVRGRWTTRQALSTATCCRTTPTPSRRRWRCRRRRRTQAATSTSST